MFECLELKAAIDPSQAKHLEGNLTDLRKTFLRFQAGCWKRRPRRKERAATRNFSLRRSPCSDPSSSAHFEFMARMREVGLHWEALQNAMTQPQGCEGTDELLKQLGWIRQQLEEMETALLKEHLEQCVLPPLAGVREVMDAVEWLAQRRWGALIAVERNQEVMQHVRGGVILEAKVSASLLESLFQPGNVLHDGAVVLRQGRIHAAGCLLPLSQEGIEPRGTRHRAALGLSQRSDALVLVVSEETGKMSLALEGQLFPDLSAVGLRQQLAQSRQEAG